MTETVNAIINNLTGKAGDAIEAIGPMVESLLGLFQTVVQETSLSGFVYTMTGVFLFVLSIVCAILICLVPRTSWLKETKDAAGGILVGGVMCFFATGVLVVMCNLSSWVAPTRQVLFEIAENI